MTLKSSIDINDTVFVFDLDDTLYSELEYVISAFKFMSDKIQILYGIDGIAEINALFVSGDADPIGTFWTRSGLPPAGKDQLVYAMRAHLPQITLRAGASELMKLAKLRKGYAILTDGRSVTQRAKLAALGCMDAAFISISEEVGLQKSSKERFEQVEAAIFGLRYVYIGDNPAKDFFIPNLLNWTTIQIDSGNNIHPQSDVTSHEFRAQLRVGSFFEILDYIS